MMIAELITAWRHHNEMSIREAATRIGIDRGALYRLERGESVNQATFHQVLRFILG